MNFDIEHCVVEKTPEVHGRQSAVTLQTCSTSASHFQSLNDCILELNSLSKDTVTKVYRSSRLILLFRYVILCSLLLTRCSLIAIAIGKKTS